MSAQTWRIANVELAGAAPKTTAIKNMLNYLKSTIYNE